MATYGRTFTHKAARDSNPPLGTPADKGKAGQFTGEGGFLAYYEVNKSLVIFVILLGVILTRLHFQLAVEASFSVRSVPVRSQFIS